MVLESERAWQATGQVHYGPTEKEKASLQFRRSLYFVEDIEEGAVFTQDNVRTIRPGLGLPPKYWDIILGKQASLKIKRGTPMNWNLIR